jgi:hypothetical protein
VKVPRLGISGAIPLLPVHVFMAWTGETSRLEDTPSKNKQTKKGTELKYLIVTSF